jgi:hypothetical protein
MQITITCDEKGYHLEGSAYTLNDLARVIDLIENTIIESIVSNRNELIHDRVIDIIGLINRKC